MDKKKYYVNLTSKEISQVKYGNNNPFTIYATDDEIRLLRAKMDIMYDAELRTYVRAHVTIMLYHHDKSNDDYDEGLTEAFQIVYNLGDEKTKAHIQRMGVLGEKHM